MPVIIGESVALMGFKTSRNFTARLFTRVILLETETCRTMTTIGQERKTRQKILKFSVELGVWQVVCKDGERKGQR